MPGRDMHYVLDVPLLDALRDTKTRIILPSGSNLAVTTLERETDGMTLRLRGEGRPAHGDSSPATPT